MGEKKLDDIDLDNPKTQNLKFEIWKQASGITWSTKTLKRYVELEGFPAFRLGKFWYVRVKNARIWLSKQG